MSGWGGRRCRSGPAANPGSIRNRGDRSGFVRLPSAGRVGDPPEWPLGKATKVELERWVEEWRKPQAIMWERLGLEVQVALYVRAVRSSTSANAAASKTTNLLRLMDGLGLTAAGLASLRWIIDDEAAPALPKRTVTSSAKDRLNVIQGGANARTA